ncbi:MAG TPA: TadE/TadG family type IV pilus assembly protein [Caulobacteraceae bacterium]|jgi:Flp pilus assembly protein TadG|nr:TadE/TadG family type IV pilus assembly protein [Caulobacteraceae bacterium]
MVADRGALSSIEFAFIVPVLLLLFLGMTDLVPGILAQSQVDHANESTGDMAGEYSLMQTSDMVDVFSVAPDVMEPLTSVGLRLRLTNIYTDGHGHAKVYWSCGQSPLTPYTANSSVTTTPTNSPMAWFLKTSTPVAANTSYIMSEIQYSYAPVTGYVLTGPVVMRDTSYLLPRSSSYVGFPWDGVSSDPPPVPTSTTTSASVTLSNGATCSYAK